MLITPMLITVAICTRNRSASLARTLRSLERVEPIGHAWELLVVDNGSTDDTQGVIAAFAGRLPIRSETEPAPGLANARNTATASALGKYMVCTDDDVTIGPNWLQAYADAFERWPDAALFGGRIIPVLLEPVTPWFRSVAPLLGGPLAIRDFGEAPLAFKAHGDMIPYGANFAIRTEIARQFPYDPELGPGKRFSGEETTCFLAMLASGHAGMWVPAAYVEHMIGPERQSASYIAQWYEMLGKTWARNEGAFDAPRLFGVPRWVLKRIVIRTVDYRLSRFYAHPETWVRKLIQLALDRGRLRYFWSARKSP